MAVHDALSVVESDTDFPELRPQKLKLAREPERNLFRNAGQYWQALGLMEPTPGEIRLTDLGRSVADRQVSQEDFAAATVRMFALPNPNSQSAADVKIWNSAGVQIHPLRLILEILAELYDGNPNEAYLTVEELCDIVIPLAGNSVAIGVYLQALRKFRDGTLDVSGWPDCTPGSNDRRSATEFLLFLAYHGFVEMQREGKRDDWTFTLSPPQRELATTLLTHLSSHPTVEATIKDVDRQGLTEIIARTRRTVEQICRPDQAKFRREVFRHVGSKCLLTGETTKEVLVASHIIHAKWGGKEEWQNGLPLRADVHILWDQGSLQILPSGVVVLTPAVRTAPSYNHLPTSVRLSSDASSRIAWRNNYQ